jgi:hypothetical protein
MKIILLIIINIQTNEIIWKNVILEKNKRKNHRIRSSYEWEITITNFNSGLKEQRGSTHLFKRQQADVTTWRYSTGPSARTRRFVDNKNYNTKLIHNSSSTVVVRRLSLVPKTRVQTPFCRIFFPNFPRAWWLGD